MSAFDDFAQASFGGIPFPVEERNIRGAIRHHEHKYPHTAGAALETLGRELYSIHFKCNFTQNLKGYPDLYPAGLARLRRLFEKETREDLVIPGIGTIKAVCIDWQQRAAGKENRSGEKVEIEFEEDIQDAFLINNLINVSTQSLGASLSQWTVDVDAIRKDINAVRDLPFLDAITESINSVLGVVDTALVYGNILEAKILGAANLIYQADRRLRVLNDPLNATLLHAMLTLWDSLLTLYKDIQKTGGGITTMVTQKIMSVIEIAKAIYNGDGTKAAQIMQMNVLDDIYAVSTGTVIRYYPVAPP